MPSTPLNFISFCHNELTHVHCAYTFTHLQVSPQFCDDLTDNGKHLKVYSRRKNQNQRPVEEVRELFPQTLQKSAVRRNPLMFKQNRESNKRSTNNSRPVCCSQDISLYPSTFIPQSRQRVRTNDDSISGAESDEKRDEGGDCNNLFDVLGCRDDQSNYRGCRECPSLSLQLNSQPQPVDDHTIPSASRQQQDNFHDVQLRLRLSALTQLSSHSQHREEQIEPTCSREDSAQYTLDMRRSCSATCARTLPYNSMVHHVDKNSVQESTCSNSHASVKDTGQQTSYTMCSMDNLSELVKDMSLGDNVTIPEHSIHTPIAAAIEQPYSSQYEQDVDVHVQHNLSNCDYRLNQLEVTTFKPPTASTPFRDHFSPSRLLQGDGILGFQESPNTTCTFSNMQRTVTTVRFCDQEMSILVKETPEHLWCSPKLAPVGKEKLTHDETSFKVSESIFYGGNSNSNHDNIVAGDNQSLARWMCSDIDVTTLNKFDDTDTTHNVTHGPPTASDEHKCEHSTIPPTQDSTHYSEEEWSVLAKQTPDDLWCSPVVKMVDNSL